MEIIQEKAAPQGRHPHRSSAGRLSGIYHLPEINPENRALPYPTLHIYLSSGIFYNLLDYI
jgi:hypothetical protein